MGMLRYFSAFFNEEIIGIVRRLHLTPGVSGHTCTNQIFKTTFISTVYGAGSAELPRVVSRASKLILQLHS